ncbi:MAG TPA: hypothetical protein VLA37_05580 [Sphingomonadaceae bacterium]|nr:hypothetical protein [Sphingomonadaceae bacterium]
MKKGALAEFTRKGLAQFMEALLKAMATRDPGAAPLALDARYTENGQELAIGDGLWGTLDRAGKYRHLFADTSSGTAVMFTTVSEGDKRAILSVRIRVKDGAIHDVEAIVVRPGLMGSVTAYADGPEKLEQAGGPEPAWFEPIPPEERLGRAELQRIANLYFEAIERNDGKGEYPFADDCVRMEHGYRTSGEPDAKEAGVERDPDTPYAPDFKAMGVKEQFETGFFAFVTNIRDRRFVVIDPELGVVCAMACFDHNGTVRDYRLADGTPAKAGLSQPFTWQIAEAFKVENGLITLIEAVLSPVPYGMKPGWD